MRIGRVGAGQLLTTGIARAVGRSGLVHHPLRATDAERDRGTAAGR